MAKEKEEKFVAFNFACVEMGLEIIDTFGSHFFN
jgi:hypothetical protein